MHIMCIFVVLLSVCVYPVLLRVPIEISHVFGSVGPDMFSWYRVWLLLAVGIPFLIFRFKDWTYPLLTYWALLLISSLNYQYVRTAIFGSPETYEGLLAILSYLGLYLAAKKYGLFKNLEIAFDIVIIIVFFAALFQLPFRVWPLFSTLGNPNHLGLFAALFFPYALIKKQYALTAMTLFLALSSQTRGSWVAIVLSLLFVGKENLKSAAIVAALLLVPFGKSVHDRVWVADASDLGGRACMWKSAIPVLKDTIITGNGPGTFGLYIDKSACKERLVGLVVDRPHNFFINTWATTGLLSALILFISFIKIIGTGKDRALAVSCASFLIATLATDSVVSVTPYFAIFLGCLSHKGENT